MCSLNIHSIVNKLNVFQSFVYSRTPDILAVTETWLTDKTLSNEILLEGYLLREVAKAVLQ